MQFFYITLGMIQLSVALNYRRLDGGLSPRHRRCCDLLIFFIVFGTAVETFTYVFQCLPVPAFWRLMDRGEAKCYSTTLNSILIIYLPPLYRILVDLCLIAMPMPIIWKLNLPRPQKCAIIGIISLSFVSIGANLRRLLLTEPNSATSITEFLAEILPRIQVWSNIEIHTALFCACAVTLKAPFAAMVKSLRDRLCARTRKGSVDSDATIIPDFLAISKDGSLRKQTWSRDGSIQSLSSTP